MSSVCLMFKVHQPYRLKPYRSTDIEVSHHYTDEAKTRQHINAIADYCYLPANALLLEMSRRWKGRFKLSFSISGVLLELLLKYRPDVISSFQKLVMSGCVEILGETYYNSLSSLYSKTEFTRQVRKHQELVWEIFKVEPVVFRNTELIHNNELADLVAALEFNGILTESVNRILKGRSPNKIYAVPGLGEFPILLRNVSLSDDIAFRFDDINWNEHPLTAEKFAGWIHSHPADTAVINLFMDYETLGVHKRRETGIFEFLENLPATILSAPGCGFSTASEALELNYPSDVYDVEQTISWKDELEACCVWCNNSSQQSALRKVYQLGELVNDSGNEKWLDTWGLLQSADYFYSMATNERCEGDACQQFNPFNYPAAASDSYRNILTDFEIRMIKASISGIRKKSLPRFQIL